MNYTTENTKFITDGTCLQGSVDATYEQLELALGEPMGGSFDGKVQAEWQIQFDDGKVATIYDWKQYGQDVKGVTDWHIGGHDSSVVSRVKQIAELGRKRVEALDAVNNVIDRLTRNL